MKNKHWFKPKKYGYGAYPVSWEGWALIAAFIAIIILLAPKNEAQVYRFIVWVLLLTLILIFVSIHKTKGKWKWRWGEKE